MKLKRITTLLFALFFMMSMLAGCGAEDKVLSTTNVTTSQESIAAPASQESIAAPASQESIAAPASQESTAAPASQESTAAPASQKSTAAPTAPANPYAEHVKLTFGTINPAPDLEHDDIYKSICKKLNVEVEQVGFTWDNWADKTKILLASGSMPDFMTTDIRNFSEIKNYADQGVLRELPSDMSKYPNLKRDIQANQVFYDAAKQNGKNYWWPRWQDSYSGYSYCTVLYRRDWTKKLGYNFDSASIIKIDDFINLCKDVIQKDPAGRGVGKTIGYGAIAWAVPGWAAICMYDKNYANYQKVNGKYVWGAAQPETLEGIKEFKKLYDEGVFWKDFFASKNADSSNLFSSGRMFAYGTNLPLQQLPNMKTNFEIVNKKLKFTQDCGVFILADKNGNIFREQFSPYWAQTIFNKKTSDIKFNRILSMMDYEESDLGIKESIYGAKGIDWDEDSNGKINLKWELDKRGNPVKPYLYSPYLWRGIAYCGGDSMAMLNPLMDKEVIEFHKKISEVVKTAKVRKNNDIQDYDLMFLSTPLKDKYASYSTEINAEITKLVVTSKDVEKDWNDWLKSMAPKIDPILKEINNTLAK